MSVILIEKEFLFIDFLLFPKPFGTTKDGLLLFPGSNLGERGKPKSQYLSLRIILLFF